MLLIAIALGPALAPAEAAAREVEEVYATVDETLATVFPEADAIHRIRRVLEPSELRRIEKRLRRRLPEGGYYVFVAEREGGLEGLALVTSEVGKVRPFTFLVAVDPDGEVRDVVVLVYRESHGSEIRHRRFLNQLRGKDLDAPLRVHRDVIHVSGATLSCIAIANGVRKVLVVADELFLGRPHGEIVREARDTGTPREVSRAATPAGAAEPDGAAEVRVSAERVRMGSPCRITVHAASRAAGLEAVDRAFDEIERVNRLLSDYRDDSELARLNRAAGTGPVAVSEELFELLRSLVPYHEQSAGAFDPTVGPLLRLWGLRGEGPAAVPAAHELAATLERVGFDRLRIDPRERTVALPAGMSLDPGAFGKGYAVDRAVAVLRASGIRSGVIDFGSTAFALGRPRGARGFRFEVRNPQGPAGSLERLRLADRALSTSGGYERYVEIDGRRYPHLLDPRTGRPARAAASATVVAPSALEADILSTAIAVVGVEAATPLLAGSDVRAIVASPVGEADLAVTTLASRSR